MKLDILRSNLCGISVTEVMLHIIMDMVNMSIMINYLNYQKLKNLNKEI